MTLEQQCAEVIAKRIVAVLRCGDHRIRGNVDELLEQQFEVRKVYTLALAGASKALVDKEFREAYLPEFQAFVDLGAEAVVICHHGKVCAAYGDDQLRQEDDMRVVGAALRAELGVPVVTLYQPDPGVPSALVNEVYANI